MRRFRSWVAAAVALAALPAGATAPLPWEGPAFSADPGALVSAAAALPARRGGRDVLMDELRVRVDERGAATSVHRVVYRVVDAEGTAGVEARWAPWAQERPRIRARVVDPGGAIHALDPADLEEREVPSSGRRLLAGTLPVEPGAVVEVEIELRDRTAHAGDLLRFPLAGPAPIRRLRVDLTAPARLPLRSRVRSAPTPLAQEVRGGGRRVRLERRDVPAAPAAEPGRPRELAPEPELVVGWGRSWPALAAQAGAAFTEGLAATDVRTLARTAAGGARTREELIHRLTAWTHQNARCTGVALGDAPSRPATPRDTLRRGEGDGKDLALLLLALLGAQGIDARPALVRGAWDEVLPDLPALGMFDHVLVRVEGTPAVWIDPCDPAAPPGRLAAALEDRLALPLGPGVRGLTRTPAGAANQNRVRIERELTLPRLGPATAVESRELSGAPAQAERALRMGLAPDARDALDQRHALEALAAEDVTWVSVEGGDDPAALLRIRMEARGTRTAVAGDEGARVPVPADPVLELLGPALARGAELPRRADLLLPFAFRAELVYRIVPPDGLRVAALPPPTDERFGPVRLRSELSTEPGGAALARWSLDCDGRRLRAADATALAQRLEALRRDGGPAVRVERVSAALFRSGRVAAALAELRAVSRRHPDDVVAAGQYAMGLLRMGFAAAAEAEIRRVLQLQPGTGWGHRVLGLVLEHDELGRYRGPGFRRAAALAAYRQARALDPGNVAARAQFADLLAHGGGPQAGEQRAAALAEYEALARDLGDHGHDGARLELLYEVGRSADAVALARQLPAGEDRDAVLLAGLAAQGDDAAALAEAGKLGSARSQALHGAARLLLRSGRYAVAAQLARAAAEAAPGQGALREEAETLSRLEPWERTRDRGDEGEALVRRAVHAAVTAAEPARAVGAFLARRLPEREADLVRRSLVAPFAGMRRSADDDGGARDLVTDLLLSSLTLERDGDRATLERVRVRLAPRQASPALTVFLVPEGKELRILATDGAWPVLAAEAGRCAAAGDRDAARRWLSLAADVMGAPSAEGSPGAVLAALLPEGAEPGLPELRRAAAALRAFDDPEGATIAPLVAARQQAASPAERRALGFALAAAYREAGRWPELLGIAAGLLREDPRSAAATALQALALARLGRTGELRAAAADALAAMRDDSTRATALAGAQLAAGDLPGSLATYRGIIGASRATPGVFNDAAWLSLFSGEPGPETLDWARRGAAGPGAGHAALNTLAAVQGALGQAAEAREALLRSLDAAGRRPPQPADWLAQGLVAEACGLDAEARSAYGRVKPEPDDPSAPYVLARRRLEALDAPRATPSSPTAPAEVAPPPSNPPPRTTPPARKDPRTPRPARRPPRASPA